MNNIPNKTAVALGSFDGLHLGHLSVINKCLESQYEPTVFCVEKQMISKRLMTQELKKQRLSQMGAKNIILQPLEQIREMSPERFVRDILAERLNAAFVCCGFNYHFGKSGTGNSDILAELCKKYDIECEVCPPVCMDGETISSTAIRSCIEQGDIKKANKMLGSPYTIDFEVVSGRHIGRLMGTPTINQVLSDDFVQPKMGVYASCVFVDGKILPAVTNFGVKPTINGDDSPIYETWIMDFSGDLYSRRIQTSLLQFIRPEQKFSGLDELRRQINEDGQTSKEIFEQTGKYN